MKQTICDACNTEKTLKTISLEVLDGEHPHSGSTMTKTVDICFDCLTRYNEIAGSIPVNLALCDIRQIKIY